MNAHMHWKTIGSLKEPFNDAVNYKSKSDKEFFAKLFLRTDELTQCTSPSTYYLIGEKGAGKTAYAVYLENNGVSNTRCKLTTMTETQYKRFIEMKRLGKLAYSDYANIWRSMLLLITSQMIIEKSKKFHHTLTGKFSSLEKAISKWNEKALNPEVESAFEVLNSETLIAKLVAESVGEAGGEQKSQSSEKSSVLRHHLLETENLLKEAISELQLSANHVLFIDGIDFRPEGVPYPDYIECIKGLSEAAWQLNTDFFNSIKDSKGRVKVMLLIRPDVFVRLNLYNSNSRLQDNCVLLNWSSTEKEYQSSRLLEVSGRFFSSQQTTPIDSTSAWNHYFDGEQEASAQFKKLLRTTFQKPRDYLTYIKIVRHLQLQDGKDINFFEKKYFSDPRVTREYADYMLGEVRNYASFYMTQTDFAIYLKFFQYLNGKAKFTTSEFEAAFISFKSWVKGEHVKANEYLLDSESLLQLFYEVNLIGYRESIVGSREDFYHWAYRERTLNNIAPKVKNTGDLMLNPGIAKALDIGKETVDNTKNARNTQRTRKRHRYRSTVAKTRPKGTGSK